MTTSTKHLWFVLYDGMNNSVFSSQVVQPLLKMVKSSDNLVITLITFEKDTLTPETIQKLFPAEDRLNLIILKRLPYFGRWSMRFAVWSLYWLLKKNPCHQIIARGPLAGWVVLTSLEWYARKFPFVLRRGNPERLPTVTVQARGLAAEEYRYAQNLKPGALARSSLLPQNFSQIITLGFYKNIYKAFIYRSLQRVEFEVYRNKRKTDCPNQVSIEAVSPALSDYLQKYFRAESAHISIAHKDLPESVPLQERQINRFEVRTELKIPDNAYVYCYSGSYKPWQYADETIAWFKHQLTGQPEAFLLILTQDKDAFESVVKRLVLPANSYGIYSVEPLQLMRYLCAADAGIIMRSHDVINWVSRPTKMLEYQAAGLKIIHNNAIAWLADK